MPTPRRWGYWPLVASSVGLVGLWFIATLGSSSANAVTPGEALGLSFGPAVVGSVVLGVVTWSATDFPIIIKGIATLWLGYAVLVVAHLAEANTVTRMVALVFGGGLLVVALIRIRRAPREIG